MSLAESSVCLTFLGTTIFAGAAKDFSYDKDKFCQYKIGDFQCNIFQWYGSCFMQYSSFDDVITIGGQTGDNLRSAGKHALSF